MKARAKHKLCRRVGSCIWGNPKCPSAKRPYPAGSSPRGRQRKLSTYGELLVEKQKLKTHYAVSEKQLFLAYQRAKQGSGLANEKLMQNLEQRLDAILFRSGLAPTIFAAKQFVNHRHVLVDGKIIDRSSYIVKPEQTVSISPHRSPAIASTAKNSNAVPPSYLEVDLDTCKVKLLRSPVPDEIPVDVEVRRVIEFYAR